MIMEKINTEKAPSPIGAYSQGIRCDGRTFLFVSGQLGFDHTKGGYRPLPVEQETQHALRNMDAVLTAGGMGAGDVVKYSIFLCDMGVFAKVNKVCEAYFAARADFPARETVEVRGLPLGAQVEISCIACKDRG